MYKMMKKLYLMVNFLTSFHHLFRVRERLKERRISSEAILWAVRTSTKQLKDLLLSKHTKSEVQDETGKTNCWDIYAVIPRR